MNLNEVVGGPYNLIGTLPLSRRGGSVVRAPFEELEVRAQKAEIIVAPLVFP